MIHVALVDGFCVKTGAEPFGMPVRLNDGLYPALGLGVGCRCAD